MAQIIQLRRDYSSNWTLANPVLAQGELGIEFDNYNVKIGNGLSSWNELTYGLGTVSLPAHTHPYAGTGITTASITGIDIAGTLNSNGLSLAIPAWLTTYSSAAGGGDWTAATISGTDMLVSTGAGTNTLYYPKYITTAADINHSHTQYLTTAMVSDAGSNFMGSNYTSHTHSYQSTGNYLTTAMQSDMTSVLQYTSNTGNITSNAVNTSVTSAYQLIANSTASLGTIYTSHTHNYQSAGAYLTTAMASENTSIYQLTANNSLSLDTGYTTHTHLYQSTGAYLTTAAVSDHTHTGYLSTAAISNHTHGSISIASTAGTDFTYSSASNGMSFSIPKWITTYAAGGGEIAFSAGGSSADLASIVFSNGSGVSFGLNGSTITASVKTDYQSSGVYLTTAAESNHTHSQYINTSISSNFLTTAALSNHTHSDLYIALGSSTYYQSSNLSSVFQTTGAYLTTAANSTHTHDYAVSTHTHNQYINTSVSGSFQLTANNSLSLDTNYTTHTHLYQSTGNYLTTAAVSDHTHSNLYIPLGNSTAYQTSVLSGTFQTTGAYLTTAAVSNHTHDYQSTGAYLTTAMASNAGSNFAGINLSTQSTSGSALAIIYNTSGLSLGIPAWITTGGAGDGVGTGTTITGNASITLGTAGMSFNGLGLAGTVTGATNASITVNTSGISVNVPSATGSIYFGNIAGYSFTSSTGASATTFYIKTA